MAVTLSPKTPVIFVDAPAKKDSALLADAIRCILSRQEAHILSETDPQEQMQPPCPT